jgi:hypothetical protein
MSETGVGLPAFLQAAQAAGMAPWLQIEPHLSGAEWRGLVEYLAAPWDAASDSAATKPWSALRVAQGREAPWTDAFDRILLELGNEMWNGLFSPWTAMPIADAATGLILPRSEMLGAWQAHVMAEMAQSPYWEGLAPHIETVIGGWARHPGFGAQAAAAAARAGAPVDHVGIAAYVGGWDEGEGVVTRSPFSYATVLANPVQVGAPVTARHKAELARLAGEGLPVPSLITYEGGPGYVLDGLNRRTVSPEETLVQEQVMKSQAAGTATLDTVLTRALGGTLSQNFFGYGRGSHWKSHAMLWAGGHAYPSWEWLEVFNHHLRGELLQVDTLNAPTVDLPAQARREALPDAPLIAVHAMRNGDRLSVVAVSRQVPGATGVRGDGSAEVTIDLPIQGAAMLTEWSMTGDYDTHDVGEDRVRPVSRRIELSQGQTRLRVSLPAGVIRAYVLDGVRWEQRTLERHAD